MLGWVAVVARARSVTVAVAAELADYCLVLVLWLAAAAAVAVTVTVAVLGWEWIIMYRDGTWIQARVKGLHLWVRLRLVWTCFHFLSFHLLFWWALSLLLPLCRNLFFSLPLPV